jgi:esterase/lipase
MTTNEIKQLILSCTRFGVNSNQKNINEALGAVDKFVNQLQQNIDNAKTSLIKIKNDYRNITAKFTCELLDELIKDK